MYHQTNWFWINLFDKRYQFSMNYIVYKWSMWQTYCTNAFNFNKSKCDAPNKICLRMLMQKKNNLKCIFDMMFFFSKRSNFHRNPTTFKIIFSKYYLYTYIIFCRHTSHSWLKCRKFMRCSNRTHASHIAHRFDTWRERKRATYTLPILHVHMTVTNWSESAAILPFHYYTCYLLHFRWFLRIYL